jgi:hypothetical protein
VLDCKSYKKVDQGQVQPLVFLASDGTLKQIRSFGPVLQRSDSVLRKMALIMRNLGSTLCGNFGCVTGGLKAAQDLDLPVSRG